MQAQKTLFITLFVSGLSLFSFAQDASRWTVDDIINTESVRSASFSPNGNAIVWTKRRALKDKDKFISDIYLTRLDVTQDGLPRTFRLTSSDANDYAPLFSKNGEDIYFLSSRDKGKKLWKMSMYGGEPQKIKEFKNGIGSVRWLNDHTLAYIAHDGKTLYDIENKKDNTNVIDDTVHLRINRVYTYDIHTKKSKRLTSNTHPVSSYNVSKDGRYLVVSLQMSPHYGVDGKPTPQYYLYDLTRNTKTQILKTYQTPRGFNFSQDNQGFYFSATTSSVPEWEGAGKAELYYFDIAAQSARKVNLDWHNGLGQGYEVSGNDVIVSLANNTTRRLAYYKKSANSWTKQAMDFGVMNDHVSIVALSEQGNKLAFNYSTASKLPEYRIVNLEQKKRDIRIGTSKVFVKLNKNLAKRSITKSEVFKWQGANNEEIDGILYYPENYQPGKKYPLVLSIHGGPTGSDTDSWSERWSTYPQIFAQRGAFVLKPNYHGSGNHGQEFAESIKGGVYYDLEVIDIVNGIKTLNDMSMIDMDKLGAMGWSNGAILTTMLTLRYPDMFKVAAAGAGDVNWSSDYGTCAFGVTFDQYYLGGAPWDDKDGKTYNETYILKSPLFEIEKIKTPTIIFHGSEDRSVPRDQGWEYYRGLQQVGIAPVRFLWFPGQPHGLQKFTHQKRKMTEELIWFDTYLFHTYQPKNLAFKEDSPLANLLSLQKNAESHAGNYGIKINQTLVPQTVSLGKDSINIALFETTNAQVKAILPGYTYAAGEDNFPATGFSKNKIEEYINALNKKTMAHYRLPNATEGKLLQKEATKVAKKENTLKYWAGYDLTLIDAERLIEKVNLSKKTLLLEVGSFNSSKLGSGKIYDLGGNAAEYFIDNGELKIYGYSAYDFVDDTNAGTNSTPEHTGFRLVKE